MVVQAKLPGFAPPPVHRCRVCRRRLTDADSIAAGIGPKCMAAQEAAEKQLIEDMAARADKFGDDGIKKLLGIIRRLKIDLQAQKNRRSLPMAGGGRNGGNK